MSNPLLEVSSLSVAFRSDGDTYINVVEDISFKVERGKCVGLVGESGCGKSVTSLSIMQLLPQPLSKLTAGKIKFKGKDMSTPVCF